MGRKPKNQVNQNQNANLENTENKPEQIIEEENLVKKTCRELGITQKELAERIGVSRQTVSDWSSGRSVITKMGETTLMLLLMERKYYHLINTFKFIVSEDVERYSKNNIENNIKNLTF